MRFKITLPATMPKEEIISRVLADERSAKLIGTSVPSNIIVVPNRIINIVIR
jgi:leucyl-tRNA synthetase